MMTKEFRCPFCAKAFMAMITVASHVHQDHAGKYSLAVRLRALKTVRAVVALPEAPWPGEVDLTGLTLVNPQEPGHHPKNCCVDGCPNLARFENYLGQWFCRGCADEETAEQAAQREDLNGLIAANSRKLAAARDEMAAIKAELAGINIRAEKITTELDRPEYVRRAAQNQMLDLLIDAKMHEAATLVMRFMRDN